MSPTLQDLWNFARDNEACRGSKGTLELLIERHGPEADGLAVIFAELPANTIVDWFYWLGDILRDDQRLYRALKLIDRYVNEVDNLHAALRAVLYVYPFDNAALEQYRAASRAARTAWWETQYQPVLHAIAREVLIEVLS